MKNWFFKLLICLDYFANVLAPASRPGMTISAHAAMAALDFRPWGIWLSKLLGRLERDHCTQAVLGDINRARDVINELLPYVPVVERRAMVERMRSELEQHGPTA